MKKFEKKTIERLVVTEITCNKCRRVITPGEPFEWQEIESIRFTGGFGSVFGDGLSFECDLCQHCLKELIGEYLICTTEMNE